MGKWPWTRIFTMAVDLIFASAAGQSSPDDVPAVRSRAIYILWALFWALMIVVAIQDQLDADAIRWWEPLLWEGSSALAATLWLMAQRRVDHRYSRYLDQPLRWFAQHLKWMPLVIGTFITGVYAVRHGVYALLNEHYEHESWPFVFVYEAIKLTLFAGLWLGIVFGFNSFARWQHERQRLLLLQKSLAEAQLSQLKAQLRPHFLFNALNTISALMQQDVSRADRLLARTSELLRSTLQSDDRGIVSLQEELRLIDLFAQIMQERFSDRVSVDWSIEPETLTAAIPSLLLQPLLENAFKHGVEKSREPVLIEVRASKHDNRLHLAVRNTGSLQNELREGVGVRNCRERLRVAYGQSARFTLDQNGGEVVAQIEIPFQESAA